MLHHTMKATNKFQPQDLDQRRLAATCDVAGRVGLEQPWGLAKELRRIKKRPASAAPKRSTSDVLPAGYVPEKEDLLRIARPMANVSKESNKRSCDGQAQPITAAEELRAKKAKLAEMHAGRTNSVSE